jgi:hypothetical protein
VETDAVASGNESDGLGGGFLAICGSLVVSSDGFWAAVGDGVIGC